MLQFRQPVSSERDAKDNWRYITTSTIKIPRIYRRVENYTCTSLLKPRHSPCPPAAAPTPPHLRSHRWAVLYRWAGSQRFTSGLYRWDLVKTTKQQWLLLLLLKRFRQCDGRDLPSWRMRRMPVCNGPQMRRGGLQRLAPIKHKPLLKVHNRNPLLVFYLSGRSRGGLCGSAGSGLSSPLPTGAGSGQVWSDPGLWCCWSYCEPSVALGSPSVGWSPPNIP